MTTATAATDSPTFFDSIRSVIDMLDKRGEAGFDPTSPLITDAVAVISKEFGRVPTGLLRMAAQCIGMLADSHDAKERRDRITDWEYFANEQLAKSLNDGVVLHVAGQEDPEPYFVGGVLLKNKNDIGYGPIRRHESGLFVITVAGTDPSTKQPATMERYFDIDDVELFAVLQVVEKQGPKIVL